MYRKSNLKVVLVLLIVLSIGFSVGYAYLNSTLTINGTTTVQKNTWDTHFDNIKVKDGSVTASVEPTIESSMKISNFQLMLEKPGDFYEFTVDVVNGGTLDAMVSNIVKTPDLTETQKKYLNYIITYENGEEIQVNQLVKTEEFVRVKVRVEYKKDIQPEDLPMELDLVNLGFEINYMQADETGVSVRDNGVFRIVANGSLDDIGTIVTIGTEKFYTIGTEGDNVKLLSMYNLYVGGSYNSDTSVWTSYGDEITGIQDSNMKGYYYEETIHHGITKFYDESQKGNLDSDYNGSIAEMYVNNYASILESTYGVDIKQARLITSDELFDSNIGCSDDSYSCENAPSFIFSTSYWAMTAINDYELYFISSNGGYGYMYGYYDFFNGIRPVIVMKKSDIEVDVKPVANGDINEIGTIVTIGDQQFYTIGTEGDNVKLLSMYNLYVGNECTSSSCTPYGSEATGMQDSTMLGYVSGQTPRKGTTVFSSDTQKGTNYSDYNGSIVEGYVDDYAYLLEEKYDVEIEEARLITNEELIDEDTFNCSEEDYTCFNSLYPWIYSTSYWSGSAHDVNCVWYVDSYGYFDSSNFFDVNAFGVRPVIVISKSLF